MATQITPEEIDAIFRQFNKEFNTLGYVTEETAEKFREAQLGIKNYTTELNKSIKLLGQASLNLVTAFGKGEQGASIYNQSLTAGANAIDSFAAKFGIIGAVVGTLATSIAKYVTAVNEQSDKLFGTYQQLSKVGAAGAGGLKEVFDNLHQFGYTLKDLDQFANSIKANAETLALYNGTVNQGTKAFAQVTQGFKDSGLQTQFRLMGLSIADINQGIAGYQRIQVLSGSTQRKTTAELVQGSAEYIKQLDLIAKLTGKSAESIQAEQEARLQESRYAVTRLELQDKADAAKAVGDKETAKRFTDTIAAMDLLLAQAPDKLKSGITGLLTGFVGSSKESEQLFRAASGAATELLGVKNRGLTIEEVGPLLDRFKKEGTSTVRGFTGQYQFQGRGDEMFGQAAGLLGIGTERAKAVKDAINQQKDQTTNIEDSVLAQVRMRQAQESTTRSMEAFKDLGIKPVTSAMENLSSAIDKVTEAIVPGTSAAGGKASPSRGGSGGGSSSLLDIIGRGESGGNYNALVGGGEANLTNMTIAEVQKFQSTMRAQGRASTAVGKYQMIAATLAEQAKKAGLDPNTTKFDQKTQDLLASQLVKQAGLGSRDPATVMKNLAGTWASLPQNMSGQGRYDGYNTNRANINPNDLMAAIQSGPNDRYSSALSSIASQIPKSMAPGTEATFAGNLERRNSDDMLKISIAKQDEMIALLKANNSQNQKMIQVARN